MATISNPQFSWLSCFTAPLLACAGLAAATGAWAAPGAYTVQQGASTTLQSSALQLNCNALDIQGRFGVGNGTVGSSGNVVIAGSGSLNGGSGLIDAGGNWSNSGTFVAGTSTVTLSGTCSASPVSVQGNNTFCQLNLGTGRQYVFPAGVTTINCALNLGSGNTISSSGSEPAVLRVSGGATVTGNATLANAVIETAAPIPTLRESMLILLSLLLALLAWAGMGRPLPSRGTTRQGR